LNCTLALPILNGFSKKKKEKKNKKNQKKNKKRKNKTRRINCFQRL
jgi:hypothetical protein